MTENKNTPNLARVFIIGCLFLACIVLLAAVMILGALYREKLPVVRNYFPTSTAIATATPSQPPVPHVLIEPPSKDTVVFYENFTSNQNDWSSYYRNQKVEVKDGKLFLESFSESSVGIAQCYCKASMSNQFTQKFYYQVDLFTESQTNEAYGIVFSLMPKEGFYIFTLRGNRFYSLDKWSSDKWDTLKEGTTLEINAYPAANTLGVSFDDGDIKLYINGKEIDSYQDKTPIKKGEIGIYVNGGNFKLVADNLFTYNIK